MRRFIDITVGAEPTMPQWPGSTGFSLTRTLRIEDGELANVSRLDTDVHCGTHVDAPLHFIQGGASIDQIALDTLVGESLVVYLPDCDAVTARVLEACEIPAQTRRLLLKTRNSGYWYVQDQTFHPEYVGLTADAAQWLVNHRMELVGVDYLSVQRFADGPATHQILLQAGVVIVEGLNLSTVQPGRYELICLPLRLMGAEGAPARAILSDN